jgi:hypothetical protein
MVLQNRYTQKYNIIKLNIYIENLPMAGFFVP